MKQSKCFYCEGTILTRCQQCLNSICQIHLSRTDDIDHCYICERKLESEEKTSMREEFEEKIRDLELDLNNAIEEVNILNQLLISVQEFKKRLELELNINPHVCLSFELSLVDEFVFKDALQELLSTAKEVEEIATKQSWWASEFEREVTSASGQRYALRRELYTSGQRKGKKNE